MRQLSARNDNEAVALERVLRSLVDEWGIEWKSLQEILQRWQRFVEQVERGYELTLHDYTVELDLRDALEEAKRTLPDRLAQELNGALSPLDQRLRFATEPAPKPLAPGARPTDRWWWFSIPRKSNVTFMEELAGNEIIE